MLNKKEIRIYNLIKRLMLDALNKGVEIKESYELESDEIKKIYLRKSDIVLLEEYNLLDKKKEILFIPSEYFEKFEKIKKNKENIGDLSKEISTYKELFEQCKNELHESGTLEKFKEYNDTLIELASKIHFQELPEYHENIIYNRGVLPEENPSEYYDHYHALEELYIKLTGSLENYRNIFGDVNLNKEIKFKVYSNRWGHDDIYRIERTLDGWSCAFFSKFYGDKTGSAIIQNLNHDYISYPSNISDYFEELWEKADKNDMPVEKLEKNIQKIADWISAVEKYRADFIGDSIG